MDNDKRAIVVYGPIILIPILVVSFFLFSLYEGSKDTRITGFTGVDVKDATGDSGFLSLLVENTLSNDVEILNLTVQSKRMDYYQRLNPGEKTWIDTNREINSGIKILVVEIKYRNIELESIKTSVGEIRGFF